MSTAPAFDLRRSLQALPANDSQIETTPLHKPHILIVDDISDNRAILARRFERHGFAISEAESGPRALQLLDQTEFDIVLLDMMMPEMDGVEVLREVRKTRPSAILPVIMVTARGAADDLALALGEGADDYITKPVDFVVALARVKTQVARRQAELRVLRAARMVQESNDALEQKVQQRTAQLLEINDRLKNEIILREKSEAESKFLAYHDALTGLPNRVLFRQALTNALEDLRTTGGALSVLFIDLDGFKNVNDTLGHSVGDALLRTIGMRLRDLLGDNDCIARLGGDEFAILQVGVGQPASATSLAAEMIKAVLDVSQIENHEVRVGASIGVTCSSNPDEHPGELLRNADLAMYRAKIEGRGTFRVFDPTMDANAQARRQLELDMRRALVQGEFSLYFQPIFNLKDKQVVSMEALLRWHHPTNGMIPPGDFIPVAEDIGLIVPLGEWVVRTACMFAARWPGDIRVAVNLSPIQFSRGNIVAMVLSALAASGLPARRLELEITESVILDKTAQNTLILNQLRDIGVRISMDDFGTGYSSLSYLRSFRFDKIKIDQCFVRGMNSDAESRAIISAIAGLGTCFGMVTTAEGVETLEQLELVTEEGCTEVQGMHISMPVPADEVLALIDRINSGLVGDLKPGSNGAD